MDLHRIAELLGVAQAYATTWAVFSFFATLLISIIALGTIPGNRKPSTGVAWLLLVLLAPWFGLVAFWTFGNSRLGRVRAERQNAAHGAIKRRFHEVDASNDLVDDPLMSTITRLAHDLGAMPIKSGNQVELLPDYQATMDRMVAEIRGAQSYVHAEFYIAARDEMTQPFFDAMAEAAARGVDVYFLFDFLGSRRINGYKKMIAWLKQTDIHFAPMLPLSFRKRRFRRPDLRNHRKLLVVDGEAGFMGSMNLTEPGYNKPKNHKLGREWVELMCRVTGPVVSALDAVFASDWYTETAVPLDVPPPKPTAGGVLAQLLPSGPGFVAENNLRVFASLIAAAETRLSITSPYFVPDESLLYTLTTAAMRGVDVELFVSETSDQFAVGHAQASYYRSLLEAGVKIWMYPDPLILHSKHFTVDNKAAVIGSSNMDMRSFSLNYEISLIMYGSDIVEDMRTIEDAYRAISRQLTLEEWESRSAGKKYLDNVFRLTSALQ